PVLIEMDTSVRRASLTPPSGHSPLPKAPRMLMGQLSSSHAFRLQCFPSHCRRPPWVVSCKRSAIKNYSICISCVALHLEISFIWQLLQSELNLEGDPGRFMLASLSLQEVISMLTFSRVE
uniref:Uncharacterized protein n=1 Tax=Sus scrofa TaxID=9823 RepID=A0A8D1FFP4_PIG